MFVGHFHRWLVVAPEGPVAWSGDRPIHFHRNRRYLTVIAAVRDGYCAIYDTETDLLTPRNLHCGKKRSSPVAHGEMA
jgi:hypothetical protein